MKQYYFSQENFGGLGDLEATNALRQANGKDQLPSDSVDSGIRTVRAKFKCNNIVDYGNQKQANLSAVYSNDTQENADFTKATPYGEFKINIDSSAAASSFFEPTKEYYINFTQVPDTK